MNFGPNLYSAGNQNWMIDQAENKNFYFANSTGLLEYNGENWNLYPVPNNTIVRSIKAIEDRIYTGAYMEAGYWEKNELGILEYTSLVPKFDGGIGDGEQFWDIEFLDDLVIFRSFAGVYFYEPLKNSITKMENPRGKPVSGIFKLNNELYYQLVGDGLFKIKSGTSQLVIPEEELEGVTITHVYFSEDELCIISGKTRFFIWKDASLKKVIKPVNNDLGYPNILDVVDLPNGGMILGTVGKGVVEIDASGNVINTFNQENVLLNNTVLDLLLDKAGNLWAGLDYGISYIDLNSTFRSFLDNRGEIGSVYASYENNGDLYLGTNQGLYLKNADSEKFKLIAGTNGQVWFIDKIGDKIFCGHDNGTYIIAKDKAVKISDRLGTWLVKAYTNNLFIQGHYNGISLLRNNGNSFEVLPMLKNFPHSTKFLEIDENLDVWVSNEHKGVFRIRLNDSLNGYKEIENYKFPGESGITSSIFKFNDTLYYSSKENVYQYNRELNQFSVDNQINKLVSEYPRVSGKMVSEKENIKVWGFAPKGIYSIQPAPLKNDYSLDFTFIDEEFRNIAIGYENVNSLEAEGYLLGVANGYLKFNEKDKVPGEAEVTLDKIEVSALDASARKVNLEKPGSFKFRDNNISFNFSTPVHDKYNKALYSYRLLGLSPNWSKWGNSSVVKFENLGFGDYTFEVKAKIGEKVTESVEYEFTIARPYYLSNLAILGYVFVFGFILYMVHILNKRHHRKTIADNEKALRMKNLEAEREIIKLRNEKLEQEMANKNRELAVSAMSLIKKNEFLTNIKDKLKTSGDSAKVKSVIRTIDKDISEEDNWKFFKKAFSNADKDFFKKLKSKHPDLTSNDLKLCAYLRLNLSSKEIAPLLNISVKSVEIKRYRLRKKMNLDRETNLTEYILAL